MKKVLIVEDQKEIREILEQVFRKELGFTHITFATDGLEAYFETSLQSFDIICSDHEMPFLKGAEFVYALRHKEGLNQHTPVIMVSGFIPEISNDMKNLENIYFVEKPIDFGRFKRYVKMALVRRVNPSLSA